MRHQAVPENFVEEGVSATYFGTSQLNQPEKHIFIFLCFYYLCFPWIMSAVYWLKSGLVPKLIDPHYSYTKLYSDTDFRYMVDHSESTKAGLLLFCGVGYWLLQCRKAARYPIYPSKDTRVSVLGRFCFTESFLKVFCFCTLQGQKRLIVKIRSESPCSSVWLGDLKVMWTLYLARLVCLTESKSSWDLDPPCLTHQAPSGHNPWVTGQFGFGEVNVTHTGPLQDGCHFNLTFMFQVLCLVIIFKMSSDMCSHSASATRKNLQRTMITSLKHLCC